MRTSAAACGKSPLGDSGLKHSLPDSALCDRLMEVVPATLSRAAVDVEPRRRENPLPWPLAAGVGILASQRPGQLDPARAVCQISRVLLADAVDVASEVCSDDRR